jgi:arginase
VTLLLGVPTALGSAHPDAAWEPARLREQGLVGALAALGVEVDDLGDVAGLGVPWAASPAGMRVRNVVAIADVLRRVRGAVHAALVAHGPPLVLLGGDPLVHAGALAGMRDALGDDPGLLWVGGDGCLDTPETTPDGHVAAMALALLLGRGARPLLDALDAPVVASSQTALVGVDPPDAARLEVVGLESVPGAVGLRVPEGPLYVALDGQLLAGLGVDAARQVLLAAAVQRPVAAVGFASLPPDAPTLAPVAALVAAALR